MADRFYIGPYEEDSGLQTSYKPFVIPDKAFALLKNAYVFRGRVRKRFGSSWLGNTQMSTRLRMSVGTYGAPGAIPASVVGAKGQMFSVADVVFYVHLDAPPFTMYVANGSAGVATFDTGTLAFVLAGVLDSGGMAIPGATPIYFYPALPVMGLLSQESNAINTEPTIAFDTQFSYQYIAGSGWERIVAEATLGAAEWTGSNSEFFWGTNWSGAEPSTYVLFVTNFNRNEPNFMRYLSSGIWNNFRPTISNFVAGPPVSLGIKLDSARILLPFKNRLIALNTWESSTTDGINYTQNNYANRARWCQIGSPLELPVGAPPEITLAWRQDIPGRGFAADCPTREQIVSAEFVKDRLIVYFERSTWELVYTNNQVVPFVWQQINTELGVESTNSIIPFDKIAVGVGNVGIHACNGQNVERIDAKIPQVVFQIHNNNEGVQRVYGIRDYNVEMLYWTFPSATASTDQPYPNRVLVYNYVNNSWSFNDDSITAFGYFQTQQGVTWDSSEVTWSDEILWEDGSIQGQFRKIIAGNQEGWTFIVDPEDETNAPALQITDLVITAGVVTITSIDHNLRQDDYVLLEGITGTGNITDLNTIIGRVATFIDRDNFTLNIGSLAVAGLYEGGGFMTRVSKIEIQTKQYNFYAQKEGRNAFVSRVDFQINRTDMGEITVDYFVSSNINPMLIASQASSALIGTGVLETSAYPDVDFEDDATYLWHSLYFTADGEYIQLYFYLSDEQMRNIDVWRADFELNAMIIHAQPSSMRLQ